jgi:hypothetical protein
MKKILFILGTVSAVLCMFTFNSCKKEGFLEKPFGVTFNEDSVFTKYENAQKLLNNMYALRPYYLDITSDDGKHLRGSLLDCATDMGSSFRLNAKYSAHMFNFGTIEAEYLSNNDWGEDVYSYHYKTIRIAFTLIDRIDEVPDAPAGQKERIKAEAKAMIAFEYFQLMKRYGGVPLITKRLDPSADEIAIPRSPLIDVYNYVIKMADEAIANAGFPAKSEGLDFGRLNKAFAYGVKAKAALLAASPLFNTATPYMSLGGDNNLICFGNNDPSRWTTAAKYAEEAITYCESNGYAIVNTPNTNINYTISYQYLPKDGNSEVMWGTLKVSNPAMSWWNIRGTPYASGFTTNMPTHNLVEKYQNKDGSYIDWSKVITTPANDPTAPYKNLDPRFAQTVFYNGSQVYPKAFFLNYDHETPSLNGANGPKVANTQFAYALRKHVYGYEDRTLTNKTWRPMCPIMRLSELYMTHAEALNETLGAPDSRVYDRVNKIRSRSGMPGITPGLSKDAMRARIQDEWAIEFAFEEYRFFDLKRWKLGNSFKGPIYDLRIKKFNNNTYTYTRYKYEDRVYFDWYYLHPFPPSEVALQYGLIQNPGW